MNEVQLYSIDAEQAIIGILLTDNQFKYQSDIFSQLIPAHFYDPALSLVFETMQKMFEEMSDGKEVALDVITVPDRIKEDGNDVKIGGIDYLLLLAANVSTSCNYQQYVDIILERYRRRVYRLIGQKIMNKAIEDPEEEIAHFINHCLDKIQHNDTMLSLEEIIQQDVSLEFQGRLFHTGINSLDEIMEFAKKHLVVIGARPGEGKSTLMTNISYFMSEDIKTCIFSLEMPRDELIDIMAAAHGNIARHYAAQNRSKYWILLKKRQLFIDDRPNVSIREIEYQIIKNQPEVVFIDNLQKFRVPPKVFSKTEYYEDICRSLKDMAKKYDCCIVLLAQINREFEKEDREPRMSDLRDSGGVEQQADQVFFIYSKPDPNGFKETFIKITKNRLSVPDIVIPVIFDRERGFFHQST